MFGENYAQARVMIAPVCASFAGISVSPINRDYANIKFGLIRSIIFRSYISIYVLMPATAAKQPSALSESG